MASFALSLPHLAFAQLSPDPNTGTIEVTTSVENDVPFYNNAPGEIDIDAGGFLNSGGSLYNQLGATLAINSGGQLYTDAELDNYGTLTINSGGQVTNYGQLENYTGGSIGGSGAFTNVGSLNANGGSVTLSNATNLVNGALDGGVWNVLGGVVNLNGNQAITQIASGTQVALNGSGTLNHITQTLTANAGTLSIYSGAPVTFSQAFSNVGGSVYIQGGSATFSNASDLHNGALSGGAWNVGDDFGDGGTLILNGGGSITSIGANATVYLAGSGTLNSIENTLTSNAGSLEIDAGKARTFTQPFTNSGAVMLENYSYEGSASSATFNNVTNLQNGTLTGGTWTVLGGSLQLNGGAPITAIAAGTTVNLLWNPLTSEFGNGGSFAQLNVQNLSSNAGTLNLETGQSYTLANIFTNSGSLYSQDSLTIQSTGTFTNSGNVNAVFTNLNNGTLTGGNWTAAGGTLYFETCCAGGSLSTAPIETIAAGTTVNLNGGAFYSLTESLTSNQGTLTIGSSGTYTLMGGALANTGALATLGSLTTASAITNSGSVAIGSGALLSASSFTQSAGATTLSGGSLSATNVAINGGAFGGIGTVIGNVSVLNAALHVGPGAGSLHIEGDYTHTGGSVIFDIDPNGSGGFLESTLLLDPANTSTISNANVVFDFLNGANPLAFYNSGAFNSNTFIKESDGSSLSSAALYAMLTDDTFSIESSDYSVTNFSYDPANGVTGLSETPVPLPAAAWLVLSGLGGFGAIARMRRAA